MLIQLYIYKSKMYINVLLYLQGKTVFSWINWQDKLCIISLPLFFPDSAAGGGVDVRMLIGSLHTEPWCCCLGPERTYK